jgi:AcrR family transcriptional regulator
MKTECDTKQKLLDTAMQLIWEQSYGSVSVDHICERAGAKKGSFYHFFPSKSDLAVAAIDGHWQKLRPDLDRIFSSQTAPLERLAAANAEIWQSLRLSFHFPGLRIEHAGRTNPEEIPPDYGVALQVFCGSDP